MAYVFHADWDVPIIDQDAGFPLDDYFLRAAHKSEDLDYMNLVVTNEGGKPISGIAITLPYDANYLIVGTGENAVTYKDIRQVPTFGLNPDETKSIKIFDPILPNVLAWKDFKTSSSEGKLVFQYEVGLKPVSPLNPIFLVLLLALTGVYSLLYAFWLSREQSILEKELDETRRELETIKNTLG